MSKIHVMSDNLANKIAAGEVVERSASVVKELVENAIDAGSSIITIDLVNGGLNGITITDNGCGMEHDDAILSFQRHATSKLLREDDLFFISTSIVLILLMHINTFLISKHKEKDYDYYNGN